MYISKHVLKNVASNLRFRNPLKLSTEINKAFKFSDALVRKSKLRF